ncbi:uncharacterized protein DUF1761 [Amycolatopsis cihanbeyliensis]|uniref:Uncharacterized protein DUF1761 n=1 Tax=Amycolatopsis cihanbeyliensis TaxID=1128664 RepID=A0A542DFV9_AMYCI|nr:uncharacterized protein DUF1761 [Amycolatopsis cihanbeyliensis]
MPELNYLAIGVATVAALIASGAWYAVLGGHLGRLHEAYAGDPRPAAVTVPVELVRNVLVSAVVAGLAGPLGISGFGAAALLGLVLWVGFPFVLLTGSVFHERVPAKLAAIHAGDWLLKLLAITVIVGGWR